MVQHAFLAKVFSILAVLSIINAIIGMLGNLFFPAGYFSQKSIPRIVSDLAFVEGASSFFVGALLAFFYSNLNLRIAALMIIGAALIGMSVVVGLLS